MQVVLHSAIPDDDGYHRRLLVDYEKVVFTEEGRDGDEYGAMLVFHRGKDDDDDEYILVRETFDQIIQARREYMDSD